MAIGAAVLDYFTKIDYVALPGRVLSTVQGALTGDAWRGVWLFFAALLAWLKGTLLNLPANLLKWGCTLPVSNDWAAMVLAPGPWLLIARAFKADVAKLGLALNGGKFVGFPNAPHYVSTHAELFLLVAAALLSVVCLLSVLCAVRGKRVIDKFASFRRQWATQALVAYAIVYIKPGSAMHSFAMPAGGLLVHALMFGRDRKLCTGGILLVMAACAWAPLKPRWRGAAAAGCARPRRA